VAALHKQEGKTGKRGSTLSGGKAPAEVPRRELTEPDDRAEAVREEALPPARLP